MVCLACQHDKREALDQYLASGYLLSVAEIMFGLDGLTLRRHRDQHLKDVVVHVQSDPVRLVRIVQDMTEMARSAVEMAKNNPTDQRAFMPAIKTVLECVRLEAELTGAHKRFDPKALLPAWQKMQQKLVAALEPFPEARDAVLNALADFEIVDDEPQQKRKRLM